MKKQSKHDWEILNDTYRIEEASGFLKGWMDFKVFYNNKTGEVRFFYVNVVIKRGAENIIKELNTN